MLRAIKLADGATMTETQAVADALEKWSNETKVDMDSKAEMAKDLAECAKRRQKEGRNSPPSSNLRLRYVRDVTARPI